ncbi:MAG: HipA N-terminal domain-containing protein [Prevotella sp.]|jgi:serine/threonine-protein kinase HipA|uniref:HipA N-terminal domain-containing protein n=1 Tax=Segatella cerevisiae TaxID=2053716 RepID=A0ABT1BUT9_9BACT|nr:HipA N-terminal domain-containing protein [Segatella cerevisiae]MCH3995527.1 HipA N-terminal domain-containing protein [Prevotella sp.]MCI1246003.1 HipA N-terminal domain-containing protein [Prevotella sp.]MCO6024455.1 HipA N-terminal domain-containing protein [Segatella cerevisiae]
MRQGKVLVSGVRAGILTEDETGYTFAYDPDYLSRKDAFPVSLTLPLRKELYHNNVLFSFFDGLIPEGWMLNIAERNWKINRRDRMALLLTCCHDCIGNISVEPVNDVE